MVALQRWKQAGHQPSTRSSNYAEASVAFNFGIRRLNVGFNVFEFVDNAASAFYDEFSIIGEFAAEAFNKADPKLLLETRNMR
jgi:hypothetical protein